MNGDLKNFYTIRLDDGTELTHLRMNGNNFISYIPVTKSTFDHNLGRVLISDGSKLEEHYNMALVQITQPNNDEWWFVLRDVTEEELKQAKLRADIDYVAMMTDVIF